MENEAPDKSIEQAERRKIGLYNNGYSIAAHEIGHALVVDSIFKERRHYEFKVEVIPVVNWRNPKDQMGFYGGNSRIRLITLSDQLPVNEEQEKLFASSGVAACRVIGRNENFQPQAPGNDEKVFTHKGKFDSEEAERYVALATKILEPNKEIIDTAAKKIAKQISETTKPFILDEQRLREFLRPEMG
ncbi:hypothetical protein COT44_03895 [Candidatus Shapirobacteria bacterium CG08_land_8_20_14_0_20_39_18]|uniref:Peptidase M41 domain-containing protein n=1 Tax=Candidatus Shapirobacteria bacterium CG08_land_8_20_14_0_20_39_18 TaxID=1974883 RepID=A0A2M6XCC4_9BACT|nr:MAG: hypothetical protein COT44_03895 [Candidatus Shapirobacteria bacterium CG08_land_8_20_14_0_20_39_18]PJE68707.1 MAG: hypothetical protein COU94_00725 [Candidatus Shapirobacteria bacterium CG10_big_fil_rev_8_21_14_0_10_38_8]